MLMLRAGLIRRRRHPGLLVLLGSACALLLWAHSAGGMGHDAPGGTMDEGVTDAAMSMCLAVAGLGGALALAAVIGAAIPARPHRSSSLRAPTLAVVLPSANTPQLTRAGPAHLQVFRR